MFLWFPPEIRKIVNTTNMITSSGFSPVAQRPESAPQMRRFRRSKPCAVGRVGLEPTADGL